MSYQEDHQSRVKRQTNKTAITLAMEGNWREAVAVNQALIANFPNDVESYNRLGKALMELGEYKESKEAYNKAVQLDRFNTIAKKNLERLEHLGEKAPEVERTTEKAQPQLFIEEIGKAGVVHLNQVAVSGKLIKMMSGDKVILRPRDTSLSVATLRGEYLGLVPSKFAGRLMKLMEGGNKYTAAVVASNDKAITVIIREIYQDPSLTDQVSFPGKKLEEIQPYGERYRTEYEEEEGEPTEPSGFGEEGAEPAEEPPAEDLDEDKEWEQEA